MRVLVVDTYYSAFLASVYDKDRNLAQSSYAAQWESLMAQRFGLSDVFSRVLPTLGHEAREVVANCYPLQQRWAAERGVTFAGMRPLSRVMRAQVEDFGPDIVYIQDLRFPSSGDLAWMRAVGCLVVGQIASRPPSLTRLRAFDLLITSFPHFASRFREMGLDAEYSPLAFDQAVHQDLANRGCRVAPSAERKMAVSFVGGVAPRVHRNGVRALEAVCQVADLSVYGYGWDKLARDSALAPCLRGQAWGIEMYAVHGQSRIAINRHATFAEGYANNMRLFEASGAGALVITEAAPNLPDLFEPGIEIVTYESVGDLVAKVRRLVADDDERILIAEAGQRRTLASHTYSHRLAEIVPMLTTRLAGQRTAHTR